MLLLLGVALLAHIAQGRHGRYCHMDEFSKGRWVYDAQNITRKAFTCCGWDSSDWHDISIRKQCGDIDNPVKQMYQIGRTDYNIQSGGHACVCDELRKERFTVSQREKYRWEADRCDILTWNATEFCRLLGPRRVLFLGDSTMVQTAATVVNMVMEDIPKGTCAPQLLAYQYNQPVDPEHDKRTMMEHLHRFSPDFVIIHFGVHFQNTELFKAAMQTFINDVNQIKANSSKEIVFVWKTTNTPHVACERYDRPTVSFPPSPKDVSDRYLWHLLPGFDAYARTFFTQHGFRLMDMSMLDLRPDAHPGQNAWEWKSFGGDCLHFCLPGPLNIAGNMLMHLLHFHHHRSSGPVV